MKSISRLERFYNYAKSNIWYWYFSIFCRIALALGFIPSGITKIMGERFASGLSTNHPMGQYLEALHQTGFYYTFIGIIQVVSAILLLIPRTVILGALLYFPVIVNICILSFAVRFDGSIFSSPLMVLANLYLLCWNYDKLRSILPIDSTSNQKIAHKAKNYNSKFPMNFFASVVAIIGIVIFSAVNLFETLPRNTLNDCQNQFGGINLTASEVKFCDCIHEKRGTT